MLSYFTEVPVTIIDVLLTTEFGAIIAGVCVLGAVLALFWYMQRAAR